MDETDLRLFPPLRAKWAPKGESAQVILSGHNAKRVISGAINIKTGKRLFLLTETQTSEEFRMFLRYIRKHYRGWEITLLLDGDSSHTAAASKALARTIRINLEWLPVRSPELNPMESIWRDGKQTICANRQYSSIEEAATKFIIYLELQSRHTAMTKSGLLSTDYWLHKFVSNYFLEPT